MQVRLELAQSKANVKRVVLKQDAVIGRSADCNLRIASSLVSRQHCRILLRDNGVFVEDLDSSNGTFVNGSRVPAKKEVAIPPGAQLSVGGVKFLVKFDGSGMPGPGSTVDLPRQTAESPEALTADWGGAAAEPEQTAEMFHSPPDEAPLELEAAEAGPPGDPVVVAAQNSDDLSSYELEVNESPVAVPVVISPDVAAAEVIDASAGDEIDTLVVEPAEPLMEAFPTFDEAPAEAEADPTETAAAEAEPPKKGLKSLFGGWGKKKGAAAPAPVAPATPAPPGSPEQQVAVAAAAVAAAAPAAAQATDDDIAGFLAGAEDEPAEAPSSDAGLGDFLKSLGSE